jgi:hypothetical protein
LLFDSVLGRLFGRSFFGGQLFLFLLGWREGEIKYINNVTNNQNKEKEQKINVRGWNIILFVAIHH